MTSWGAVLDDFEARLSLAEAMLELGLAEEAPAAFVAPELVEPFPSRLLARAEDLLGRARTVEQSLRTEQHRIREELRRLPKAPVPERRSGAQFEFEA